MKPWRRLRILGKVVGVFKIPHLVESEDALGIFRKPDARKERAVILLDDKLRGEVLTQTMVHEMFHAVLERTHVATGLPDEIEEAIVDQFATAIVENFKLTWKR